MRDGGIRTGALSADHVKIAVARAEDHVSVSVPLQIGYGRRAAQFIVGLKLPEQFSRAADRAQVRSPRTGDQIGSSVAVEIGAHRRLGEEVARVLERELPL